MSSEDGSMILAHLPDHISIGYRRVDSSKQMAKADQQTLKWRKRK